MELHSAPTSDLKSVGLIFSRALRDVLLLARKELSFPIEENRYREIMDERINSMEKNLEELFVHIRQSVQARM